MEKVQEITFLHRNMLPYLTLLQCSPLLLVRMYGGGTPFPQYENDVDLTFLLAIIEFLVENIPPKPGIVVCSSFTVRFCSCAWDGKQLNSGAFIWGSKIYGTIPSLSHLQSSVLSPCQSYFQNFTNLSC